MSSPLLEYLRPSLLNDFPPTGHAIIEASAGTGKTYAIEHLIIELLRTAANSIEDILVVTFTEKATAELRARIRTAIENILRGRPGGTRPTTPGHQWASVDEAARLRLEHALANFERAPIFTIHAFCNRVLTEFAFHSGARFNLDLVDGRRAFRTTFRAMLRERFAVDPLMRPVLEEWLQGDSVDKLESLLFEAHRSRYPAALALDRPEEAGAVALVAGRPDLLDLEEQRVAVAVEGHLLDRLGMAADFALHPKLLAGPAPKPGLAGFEGLLQGGPVHPGHHQHAARLLFLNDCRDQAVCVEFQLIVKSHVRRQVN